MNSHCAHCASRMKPLVTDSTASDHCPLRCTSTTSSSDSSSSSLDHSPSSIHQSTRPSGRQVAPVHHRPSSPHLGRLFSRPHLSAMSLFLLLLLSLSTCSHLADGLSTLPTSGLDVVSRCQQNCPQQLNLDDDLDIACNSTCKLEQCELGCQFWNHRPLPCFDVCANTSIIDNWVIYCAIGCNHAHTVYVDQVKAILGSPAPPKLVAGSLSNDSLAIEWTPTTELANLTYRVQMKYANVSSTWTYAIEAPVTEYRLQLKNLHAYTSYLFRIEWIIVPWLRISLFSQVSDPLTTLPYGVPSTPCIITSCLAISSSQISVSWNQPAFPNGPIIAYTLYLADNSSSHRIVKDLHAEQWSQNAGPMNYVFNGLKAATEYTVSIVTFNNFGEGPLCERRIATFEGVEQVAKKNSEDTGESSEEDENDSAKSTTEIEPYKLFIASNTEVGWRNPQSLSFEEIIYHLTDYAENHEITGMAIHVRRKYLFVADSSGTIRRVLIKENSQEINQVIRITNGSNNPSHLSIDWLNDRLYMVEDNRISRCNLDGEAVESVVTGFRVRPHDMKVDPYNGWLFWLLSDVGASGTGLYRVDLANLGRQVKVNYASAQLVYQDRRISTFAVNYFDYRIYFPLGAKIYSITIDGKDAEAIRDEVNSNTPEAFVDIENMIIFDRRLYFTNGSLIYSEEEEDSQYYHNSFSYDTDARLVSLLVMDNQSQPYPVPLNPVQAVQAIFLDESAKISWEKPALFGGCGAGAWQDWRYEVSIEEADSGVIHLAQVNNITNCVAEDLKPDTVYLIKVRAWSAAGKGSWSDIFRGATLPSLAGRDHEPYAVVSTGEGLLKTDITGKLYYPLLSRAKLNLHISDVVWYKEMMVLNTEKAIMAYHSSGGLKIVANVTGAASIKVDWYAGKLYWSNPFDRMICRSNIDGTQTEILPIIAYAKEIALDSPSGYLYWSTMYALKYSFLNGAPKSHGELFRATEIKSITVNSLERVLYWVALNGRGESTLYRTDLLPAEIPAGYSPEITTITALPDASLVGPVATFADRLFWRQTETNEMKISDSGARTFATIKELTDVYAFALVDYHQNLINSTRCVIPEPIDPKLVEMEGTWENFTLTWAPVVNVNYGQVFYDLVLEDSALQRLNIVLNVTHFNYAAHLKPLKPYSAIKVAIRPFTYWASAKQVVLTMHTPSSIPSKPRDIRVFTEMSTSSSSPSSTGITAEARWRPPADPNGIILSYTVSLWNAMYNNKDNLRSKVIENQLSYRFADLLPNATYYFEVRATTDAGEGPPSEVVQFKTYQDAAPSRLLLAEADGILLADMDLRQNDLVTKAIGAQLVDYVYNENTVYWVEEGNYLKRASLSLNGTTTNFTLIGQLHEQTTGLAVDWIGRRLYLATVDRYHNKSTIWLYDYSHQAATLRQVTSFLGRQIACLRVNPFTSELIWSEVSLRVAPNLATLKVCRLQDFGTSCASYRDLFTDDQPRTAANHKACNCTYSTTVARSFALDHASSSAQTRLIYYDLEQGHFASTDLSGCQCRRLTPRITGPPPHSITFDQTGLYWTNDSTSGTIYRALLTEPRHGNYPAKPSASVEALHYPTAQIHSLTSYNRHNQPNPVDASCLIPHHLKTSVKLVESTAFSLTLRVEVTQTGNTNDCGDLSQASLRYRIRYRKHFDNVHIDCRRADVQQCRSVESDNATFTVTDLEPFTNYTFSIELDNYYLARVSSLNNLPSEEYRYLFNDDHFIFSTAESRPGPPRNVRAVVESPEKILILWDRPEKLNSNQITYEVWWYSVELNRKSVFHSNDRTRHGSYFMYLENIKPGKEYNVSVRAYADNHQFMESTPIRVRAFEEPSPLVVAEVRPRSISLKWDSPSTAIIENHQLFVQADDDPTSQNWTIFLKNSTVANSTYDFAVTNLLPSRRYRFQMALTYAATKSVYTWPRKVLVVSTAADVPDAPILHPIAPITNGGSGGGSADEHHHGTAIYKISWDAVKSNAKEDQVYYALYEMLYDEGPYDTTLEESEANSNSLQQTLALRSAADSKWNLVYNGTDTYWVISGLESGRQHLFRLAASNTVGQSNFTAPTSPFYLPFQYEDELAEHNENMIIFVVCICVAFVLLIIIVALFSLRRYHVKEKSLDDSSFSHLPIELVPWRELPAHPHLPNTLYVNSNIESVDLGDIKIIDYNTIIRGKALGSGAFGEVFEGVLQKTQMKVAIKILNKDSTDAEQINFLKEAKFMSKFKHPNILQLLGVCLNAEQPIIIMELMEGGDLLRYIRANRPEPGAPSELTLDDLLSICIDIGKGCQYLETVNSVHRDLAARNCLVSSLNPAQRQVKIADFGLSRGLYKQNYYRKEGGLMPVRWMAPESLVDGVFTTQSDVWSFGIVMYEVMTFGEQPYQGLSNDEVLKYVRDGHCIGQPPGCPFEIYSLMRRCWAYHPRDRPSFGQLLADLAAIRRNYQTLKRQHFEAVQLRGHPQFYRGLPLPTSVHNQNYISMLERLSMHSSGTTSTAFSSLRNSHILPYNGFVPSPHHSNYAHPERATSMFARVACDEAAAYLNPNSRMTTATLVLEPSLSGTGSGTSSSNHSPHSHSSTPNLSNGGGSASGPYWNANKRPATIYESHDTSALTRSIDIDGYQIPIKT